MTAELVSLNQQSNFFLTRLRKETFFTLCNAIVLCTVSFKIKINLCNNPLH